jgi:hypothetical protein
MHIDETVKKPPCVQTRTGNVYIGDIFYRSVLKRQGKVSSGMIIDYTESLLVKIF